jgi:predicted alpha-1,2-mannosidase
MIGTDGHGHTFPGATVPFGMIQLSPSNGWKAWDWCSGYHYSDSIIKGFAHNHISGAGLSGLGDILIMPTTGDLKLSPGTEDNPDSGYMSRFSHDHERARAGYYSVHLNDYDIKVELTASQRVGFHRYSYFHNEETHIIIDPTHHQMESIIETEVEILSTTEIRGYKMSKGEAGTRKVYFYSKFSKPFVSSGLVLNDSTLTNKQVLRAKNTKAWALFNVEQGEQLEVQTALSFVSYEGAFKNYQEEGEGKKFNEAFTKTEKIWRDKLSRIMVEGSKTEKRNFYTALYHSYISPNIFSDVDGKYMVEGKQYHSDFDQYSTFSTWDTYRSLHPLLTILEQKKTADFVNSLSSRFTDSKVGLPVWELLGHDNACMIGYSPVSPMADAILKNIKGINIEDAYQAMKAAAMSLEKHSPNYDVNGMQYYNDMGYVPGDIGCSVSKTTEQNYYDWTISQVAERLGKTEDAEFFGQRSKGYLNLYNPVQNYLWPKSLTGNWLEMDLTNWESMITNYVSGNIWGYSSYTPHDMAGIITKMGGRKKYASWLDNIFNDHSKIEGATHVDISGFIGKYGHGDEPSHHMPYLNNYVGQPWKTAELVREVTSTQYLDTPGGLINNEDLGQMSSWYVFSSLGMYPVCPGSLQYVFGSPHFKEASIKTEKGNVFTIKAPNASSKNIYIQSVKLNGLAYELPFIEHKEIMAGGILEFDMGSKPSDWGTEEAFIKQLSGNNLDAVTDSLESTVVYVPFAEDKENCFGGSKGIVLKCNTPDAEIRYTLNGKTPTSKSKLYTKPVTIKVDCVIKAKAFIPEQGESFVFEKQYYNCAVSAPSGEYPKVIMEPQPEQYGKTDGSQLVDGFIGSINHNDKHWTGSNNEDISIIVDLGKIKTCRSVTLGYLIDTRVWIFSPKTVDILVSTDNVNFEKVKSLSPQQVSEDAEVVNRLRFDFNQRKAQFIKVSIKNIIIPDWHFGNGHNGWFFADEICVN